MSAWYPEHQEEIIYYPNMEKKKKAKERERRDQRKLAGLQETMGSGLEGLLIILPGVMDTKET